MDPFYKTRCYATVFVRTHEIFILCSTWRRPTLFSFIIGFSELLINNQNEIAMKYEISKIRNKELNKYFLTTFRELKVANSVEKLVRTSKCR